MKNNLVFWVGFLPDRARSVQSRTNHGNPSTAVVVRLSISNVSNEASGVWKTGHKAIYVRATPTPLSVAPRDEFPAAPPRGLRYDVDLGRWQMNCRPIFNCAADKRALLT